MDYLGKTMTEEYAIVINLIVPKYELTPIRKIGITQTNERATHVCIARTGKLYLCIYTPAHHLYYQNYIP